MNKAFELAKKLRAYTEMLMWYEQDPQRRMVFDRLNALSDAVMNEIDYYLKKGKTEEVKNDGAL